MDNKLEARNTAPNTSGLRPWRKGQSGNPNGRRARGLATAERLRNALVDELPAILEVIVKNAKAGDLNAAKTILERVLAPLKSVEAPAYIDPLDGTLSEQGQVILQSMTVGSLAPGQAAQLLGALAAQAKLVEVDELGRRLTAIEKRLGATNGRG